MPRYTPPPADGTPYTPPQSAIAPTPIGTPVRLYPPWMEPPLPGDNPTPSGSNTVRSRRVGGNNAYLVGAGRRFPILYGRLLIVPDFVHAQQKTAGGKKSGYYIGVVSEGPISGIKEWFDVYGDGSSMSPGGSIGADPLVGGYYTVVTERFGTLSQTQIDSRVGPMPGVAHFCATTGYTHAIYPCFIAEGRLLYDPRLGAWGAGEYPADASCEFSANPALEIADLICNPQYGIGDPPSSVDWASFEAGADRCDTLIGGVKQYECHIYIRETRTAWEWMETIGLHAGGMRARKVDGLWKLDIAEEPTTVDATITLANIVAGTKPSVSYGGGAGFADLPNRFIGEWTDSAAAGWPTRQVVINHAEIDAGAAVRESTVYRLDGCLKEVQAYRCLWAIAYRTWSDVTIELDLKPEMLHLKVGSRVTLQAPELGFADQDFIVTAASYTGAGIRISALLFDASVWTPGDPGTDDLPVDLWATPPALTGVSFEPERTVEDFAPWTYTKDFPGFLCDRVTFAFAKQLRVRLAIPDFNCPGAIAADGLTIIAAGSGYSPGDPITIIGEGAGAVCTVSGTNGSGGVIGVTVAYGMGGSGYWPGTSSAVVGGAGAGAQVLVTGIESTTDTTTLAWDDPELARNEYILPLAGNAIPNDPTKIWAVIRDHLTHTKAVRTDDPGQRGGLNEHRSEFRMMIRLESIVGLLGAASTLDQTEQTVASAPTFIGDMVVRSATLTHDTLPKTKVASGDTSVVNSLFTDDGKYNGHLLYHDGNLPLPTGVMLIWSTATAPTGYLLCDGTAVSRTTYAALFAVIGTTYGAGNGSTTFNVPDLRQRFPLGKAGSGTGSTLGGSGGAIDHAHGVDITSGVESSTQNVGTATGQVAANDNHTHAVRGSTDGQNPPFLAVTFIIKT